MNDLFKKPNPPAHPNAYLAQNPDLQELYCVYCEPRAAEAAEGQADALYRYGEGCALMLTDSRRLPRLEELFRKLESHAGVCGPFARSLSAYGCAEKARAAAVLGPALEPEAFLHRYADVRLWSFVELADGIISGEGRSINDFCHGSVFDICEHDRLEGTRYRETLMAYLRSGCNLRAASETVGVHRNTLAYRKKRLEELFNLDLGDPVVCFELLFSFIALEAAGIDWEAYRKPARGDCPPEGLDRALWNLAERRPVGEAPDCVCRLCMIDARDLPDGRAAELYCAAADRFPNAAAAYNDHWVYLLTEDGGLPEADFRALLDRESCCGAMSQPFRCGRLDLHAELLSYTLPAARRLDPEGSFFLAKDFCSLAFFTYLQRRTALDPFFCDEVIRVMDYDYRRGTTYARSLYAYLSSFMDMSGAAQEASVHRNTLEYQIKKALAIANVEDPDDRLRFEMMCTYKMLIASET